MTTRNNRELLVFGYLKDKRINISIPIDLIQLCLKWYIANNDKWDTRTSNSTLKISDDDCIVTQRSSFSWRTAFGKQNIGIGDKQRWVLKLNNRGMNYKSNKSLISCTRIGIIPSPIVYKFYHKINHTGSFDINVIGSYALSAETGSFWFWNEDISYPKRINIKYAKPIYNNDIIIVELDMTDFNKCTLKYTINDKCYGHAPNCIIDPKYKYKICAAFKGFESLTLLQY